MKSAGKKYNNSYPVKKIILKSHSLNSFWYKINEIKEYPKSLKPGDFVEIYNVNKNFLGIGYANPNSKIFLRVISFKNISINENFIEKSIIRAFEKRKILNSFTDSYRVVHSEADLLPGLIIDKYKNVIVIQINTAGMENLRHFIISSIVKIFNPLAIYEKSDENMRKIEGLINSNGLIYGNKVEEIEINENNLKFIVNFEKSQKTGFFLDQRENRKIIAELSKNCKVLDLFSNTGGFGIYAMKHGAKSVKFVEISKNVTKFLKKNLELNNIKKFEIIEDNVFNFIEKENEKYDLIIIDPPSFAKTKNEKKGALKGYRFLISNAIKLLNKNGFIALFSCSHNIDLNDLILLLKNSKNIFEIKKFLFQDFRDHPYILQIPQTLYLKGLIFSVF